MEDVFLTLRSLLNLFFLLPSSIAISPCSGSVRHQHVAADALESGTTGLSRHATHKQTAPRCD